MTLQELEKFGIPSSVINLWSQRQGESLLPVQSRAVRRGLLGEGRVADPSPIRMLISAPTGSGKSFCAEMAMLKALTERKKVVLLLPLKSLVEQWSRTMESTYAQLGIRTLVVTGDYPDNDVPFTRGHYQVAIVVYEKMDQLLTRHLDALGSIGLVVIDEIQSIAESGRGAILERLLTKIVASVYEPSLLGLSAVIGDSESAGGRLADWLDASFVEETHRPVDLLRGIVAEGSFRFRSFNSGVDGSEPFLINSEDDRFEGFIEHLKNEHATTIVFLKSRRETVACAMRFASAVNWPSANKAIAELEDEEPSYLIRSLRQVLSYSIAFHNADLSLGQRRVVEEAFVQNEIRVIFSTTTLAMGVDFPADSVYLETARYQQGVYGNRPTLVPVSRAEFDNMTGRAGRIGRCGSRSRQSNNNRCSGRAIMLADSEFDRDILWNRYIVPESSTTIESAFESIPLTDWVLNLIVAGLASSVTDLAHVLHQTFYARINQPREMVLVGAVEQLIASSLIIESRLGSLQVTPLGQEVAGSGLTVKQVNYIRAVLGEHQPDSLDGWTAFALGLPDWRLPSGFANHFEAISGLIPRRLYGEYEGLISELAFLSLEPIEGRRWGDEMTAKVKALMLLHDWCRLVPVEEIEQRFQVHLGQILTVGETASHFVGAMIRLARVESVIASDTVKQRGYAFSLRYGLPFELAELQAECGSLLNRTDIGALYRVGIDSLVVLMQSSSDVLSGAIKSKAKLGKLYKILKQSKEELEMRLETTSGSSPVTGAPITTGAVMPIGQPRTIEIDGSCEGERFLVRIDGFPIRLTGKSFKYFAKLAWARRFGESGWLYKEEIEIGFNQARYLYRMKNEIANGLKMNWPVIENNRLGYYRLMIDSSSISLNFDNLRDHPDYEVRGLVANTDENRVN